MSSRYEMNEYIRSKNSYWCKKSERILINIIYLSRDGCMAYGGSKIEVRKFYFNIALIKLLK